MLTKNDVLEAILMDLKICKHLVGKVPAGGMDYCPGKGQRSTLELLRYLSFCAIGGCSALFDGNWETYKAWDAKCAELDADAIPAAMDAHGEALKTWFAELSDEDFDKRQATTPLGETMPLGRALLEMPLKWMTAYRMQLFLYAKQAGNTEIWTPNCWGGVDMERSAAPA